MALAFPQLRHPIVQAPMAGGPSTPALAAAVSDAGGLGFLAAGYLGIEQLAADINVVGERISAPFGVNLFVLTNTPVDDERLTTYARSLQPDADRLQTCVGRPRFDDDAFADKLELLCAERVPIVSFTFGLPDAAVFERLHDQGIAVWITVTDPAEARAAAERGADALVTQGTEAGGHRGSFDDIDGQGELALLPLLRLTAREVDLPLVASGGIADGPGVAAALVAGARAVQIGTAFMRCPEAATTDAHSIALTAPTNTRVTRAFTGRRARGLINRFMNDHGAHAPAAYPQVHYLTAPLRAAARARGDTDIPNLWAGEAHALAQARPAAELVQQWSADAQTAIERQVTPVAASLWPVHLDPSITPDLGHSALVIIDTQVDFVDGGACPIAGTTDILPEVAGLVASYRRAGLPIVHVVRLYRGEDVDLARRTMLAAGADIVRPGSPGSQIVPELCRSHHPGLDADWLMGGGIQRLGDNEVVIWKPRWSAFHRTALTRHLEDLGVTTLVFSGCNFPNCPRASILDASERDYRVVLATDATSQIKPLHLAEARAMGVICADSGTIVERLLALRPT